MEIVTAMQQMLSDVWEGLSFGGWEIWYVIGCILLSLFLIYLFRIHIAYVMAKHRHRDPLGWVLLSLLVSPILTWIILFIVGDERR
ncbi:MAG: hypothetical protein IJ609_02335 [Paludibacteraceae bacterium]|nr:hypothetical protein [Paludibacteraceae bacterium]MBR1480750.1 hypothetical protein [Paludibacteraceae bacterium]